MNQIQLFFSLCWLAGFLLGGRRFLACLFPRLPRLVLLKVSLWTLAQVGRGFLWAPRVAVGAGECAPESTPSLPCPPAPGLGHEVWIWEGGSQRSRNRLAADGEVGRVGCDWVDPAPPRDSPRLSSLG